MTETRPRLTRGGAGSLDPRYADGLGGAVADPRPHVARAMLAVVSAVVLVISVGGWVSYSYFNAKIGHVALNLGGNRPDEAANGTQNYLLVGTDSRAGTGGAYGNVDGQRSDSTILVHLDKNGTTTMVSFPRDLLVTLPDYTDPKGRHYSETRGKFNSAIENGGPGRLVTMIEGLTNIRIDHYVSIDLAGFKSMTDAIGGVDLCVLPSNYREWDSQHGVYDTNTHDAYSGWRGGPGTLHVNGELGLAFVRQRHGLAGGDIARIQRQQQFLGAVFRKATTGGVLANPVKLEGLVSTATSALTLDDNTNISDLRKLATRMRGVAAGQIKMETIPNHTATAADGATDSQGNVPPYGDVQILETDKADEMLATLRGDDASKNATGAPTVPASQVNVVVKNGTRRAGLASTTTTQLVAKGFTKAVVGGNADLTTYVTTRVRYGPGQESAARTVQAVLPGSRLETDSAVTGVQVIVGSSFTAVGSPQAGGGAVTGAGSGATSASGAGTPTAAPTTAPAPTTAASDTCTI